MKNLQDGQRKLRGPVLKVMVKFDKDNYRDQRLYAPLLKDFEFRPSLLSNSRARLVGLNGSERLLDPVQYFVEKTLPLYRKCPKAIRPFVLARNLDRVLCYNALPIAFRDAAVHEFFTDYPQGEIWYVRQSKQHLSLLWDMERKLGKQLRRGVRNDAARKWDIQPYAGLDVGSLPYHALLWFSTLFFPNILFAISPQLPGIFLFFPRPIPSFLGPGDHQNLLGLIISHIDHVYSDWRNPSDWPRSPVSAERLTSRAVHDLLQWWIYHVAKVWKQFGSYKDPTSALVVGLTLNRVLVEGTLLNIYVNNFQRKTLLFQIIDKVSSIVAASRNKPSGAEAAIWRELVSRTFIRTRLRPFVQRIPGSLCDYFTSATDWLLQNLEVDGLTPGVLRAYRNSSHGYKIRDAITLLKHCQPIENDVPDLASLLVLYMFGSNRLSALKTLKLV